MGKKIGLFISKANVKEQAKKVREKVVRSTDPETKQKTGKVKVRSKNSSISDLKIIAEQATVEKLSYYKNKVCVITDYDEYMTYMDNAVKSGYIAVDTETNKSLDPLTCKLMGLCLYYPGALAAYVPVSHTDLDHNLLENQLTCEQIKEGLKKISNTKILAHNGKFDYEVLKVLCGFEMDIYWDTMLGAQILDENESAKLKDQYALHVDSTVGSYSIEEFYKNIPYEYIDPEIFTLYAATDSFITYELFRYQEAQFAQSGYEKLYSLFKDVEMKVWKVAAGMELRGITIDKEFAKRLSDKYHLQVDAVDEEIKNELSSLEEKIKAWRETPAANEHPMNAKGTGLAKSKSEQLADPPVLSSPTQLAILLYDVLGVKPIDKKSPRSTAEDILVEIEKKYKLPLCSLILKKRGVDKLLSTYIDAIPAQVNTFDNKLHAHFNQMGTEENNVKTGRFSSTNPNLQNIPSHNKEIRMMFRSKVDAHTLSGLTLCIPITDEVNTVSGYILAKDINLGDELLFDDEQTSKVISKEIKDDIVVLTHSLENVQISTRTKYIFVGSDFSQQEPRLFANYSQDPNMMDAYRQGKDLYATMGAGVYKMDYWDCMEHHQDGTPNPDGKKRRSNMKSLLLGIMYQRGANSIAEQLECSYDEAQKIIEDFYTSFPQSKKWVEGTKEKAKKLGYVEDLWGRRRRLPQIQLPEYEVVSKQSSFNPLLGSSGKLNSDALKYTKQLTEASSFERKKLTKQIEDLGYTIHNNGGKIADCERQAVNSPVQGGAATMSKKAMILVDNDKELLDLDAHIVLQIHDEFICECPEVYADKVAVRLTEVMKHAAEPDVTIPFKCDADTSYVWYYNDYCDVLKSDYYKLIEKNGMGEEAALQSMISEHTECTPEQIVEILKGE